MRIDADPTDSFFVAKQISEYAKNENYDIVMTGKETINYNGAQIGGMLAELLDMPFVSLANKLDVTGTQATLERDVQGGIEVVEVDFPFVLSASKECRTKNSQHERNHGSSNKTFKCHSTYRS